VSRDANAQGGTLRTPLVVLVGNRMTLNAEVQGEIRVRLLDGEGNPIPGFDAADSSALEGDSLSHQVEWAQPLAALRDRPVSIEFLLRDARLYGFDLIE